MTTRAKIGIPELAFRLRRPYRDVFDALLRGDLQGERVGRRWMVYDDIEAINRVFRVRETSLTAVG